MFIESGHVIRQHFHGATQELLLQHMQSISNGKQMPLSPCQYSWFTPTPQYSLNILSSTETMQKKGSTCKKCCL